MNKPKNRRTFITQSVTALGGMTALSLLSACSSFDDYFFDDTGDLDQEVVIIGGGIAGLYFAHLLRQKRLDFRLYEAGNTLGGRIRSFQGQDYGASLLKKSDVIVNKLVDEFKLNRVWIDKNQFYFAEGMQVLVDQLKERVLGLLPYRNFRLRWRLVEVSKTASGYELIIERPEGQKKINCRHLVMALPPSQWPKVKGLLQLPEMAGAIEALNSLSTENVIKMIFPVSAASSNFKSQQCVDSNNFQFREIYKKATNGPHIEVDIKHLLEVNYSIDYVFGELRRRLQINYPFAKMTPDQYLDWRQVAAVQGAYFKFSAPPVLKTSPTFQVIGDAVALKSPNTVEGALETATEAAKKII